MSVSPQAAFKAVFFDYGGVLVRTGDDSPRRHLAARLGNSPEELYALVFGSDSARQASLGTISAEEHWKNVMRTLGLPAAEWEAFCREFFSGDGLDHALLEFLRSLRPQFKVGLISNAWSDLRAYMQALKMDDAFDEMIISAETGVMKPDARIYHLALNKLGVAPGESIFVDDFIENVEGARGVGMTAVHFTQPEQALADLKRLV